MTHQLWVDPRVEGYGHGHDGGAGGWPGLRQVVCVRTRREFLNAKHGDVIEDHYYLTSLSEQHRHGTPEALLRLARGHWEIENKLHHVKDRSMGEDAERSRAGATVMARLRSVAVGLFAHIKGESTPLKQVAVAANPMLALRLLRRKRFPKGG